MREKLEKFSDLLVLPQALNGSDPSWFGFLITVKEKAGFTRNELVGFLEESSIQTRNLFAGNLIKHPCFDEMRKTGQGFRVVGTLEHTDYIMNQSFWIGVYPGMTERKMDYMVSKIQEFVEKNRKR